MKQATPQEQLSNLSKEFDELHSSISTVETSIQQQQAKNLQLKQTISNLPVTNIVDNSIFLESLETELNKIHLNSFTVTELQRLNALFMKQLKNVQAQQQLLHRALNK